MLMTRPLKHLSQLKVWHRKKQTNTEEGIFKTRKNPMTSSINGSFRQLVLRSFETKRIKKWFPLRRESLFLGQRRSFRFGSIGCSKKPFLQTFCIRCKRQLDLFVSNSMAAIMRPETESLQTNSRKIL